MRSEVTVDVEPRPQLSYILVNAKSSCFLIGGDLARQATAKRLEQSLTPFSGPR